MSNFYCAPCAQPEVIIDGVLHICTYLRCNNQNCEFGHLPRNIARNQAADFFGMPVFLTRGWCATFLYQGNCPNGNECPSSHPIQVDHYGNVLPGPPIAPAPEQTHLYPQPAIVEGEVAKVCDYFVKTGTCKFKNCKWNHNLVPISEICWFFASNGNCNSGSKCRFEHMLEKDALEVYGQFRKTKGECQNFITAGTCKFGNKCFYSHVDEETLVCMGCTE